MYSCYSAKGKEAKFNTISNVVLVWLKFVEFAKLHILPKFVHPKPNLVQYLLIF